MEPNKESKPEGYFFDMTRKAFDEITRRAEEAWGKFQKEFGDKTQKNAPEIEAWKKKAAALWEQFQKEASVSYQSAKEKWGPQMETFLKDAQASLNKANDKAEEFAEKARQEFNQWRKGGNNQ